MVTGSYGDRGRFIPEPCLLLSGKFKTIFYPKSTSMSQEPTAASCLSSEDGHAFTNIFSIIIANAEMIAEDGPEGEQVHRRLQRMVAACRRGEELVEKIRGRKATLPNNLLRALPKQEQQEPTGPLQGRILIVDDEPDVLEILRRYLSKHGLDVEVLTDSVTAMEHLLAKSDAYDLVLTDFDMPRCNGVELCQRLHQLRPELPVVLMTGYGNGITTQEIRHCPVKALLCKPIDRRLLLTTIGRLLFP